MNFRPLSKLFAKTTLAIAFVMSFTTSASYAATLDFDFSFDNPLTGGAVTGIIRGLSDNTSNQAASSVEVLTQSGPDGTGANSGIAEYVGFALKNTWTVSNGQITYGEFFTDLVLDFSSGGVGRYFGITFQRPFNSPIVGPILVTTYGLTGFFDGNNPSGGKNLVLTPTVAAVPLPAGGVLLLTGLFRLVTLRRKTKPAA